MGAKRNEREPKPSFDVGRNDCVLALLGLSWGGWGALSSISLPFERAPPLIPSMQFIIFFFLQLFILLIFHIKVLIFCNSILFPCSLVTCSYCYL